MSRWLRSVSKSAAVVMLGLLAALPLDARPESTDEDDRRRREVVTFTAAYGGERIMALVHVPKNAKPPYQTVVYFPGQARSPSRA